MFDFPAFLSRIASSQLVNVGISEIDLLAKPTKNTYVYPIANYYKNVLDELDGREVSDWLFTCYHIARSLVEIVVFLVENKIEIININVYLCSSITRK